MVYDQLLDYVGNVALLENAIEHQKGILQKIDARCGCLGKPAMIGEPRLGTAKKEHFMPFLCGDTDFEDSLWKKIGFYLFYLFFLLLGATIIGAIIGASVMIYFVVLLIIFLIDLIRASRIHSRNRKEANSVSGTNHSAQKQYELALQTDAERCQREKDMIAELSRIYASIADNVSHLQAKLDGLYAQNVIFPDFRGVVPISYLYKYLAARICTRLEGPDGAYAQYLQDDRANRITSRLDQISAQISQIAANQRVQIGLLGQINHTMIGMEQSLGNLNNSLTQTQQELSRLVNVQVDANSCLNSIGGQLNRLSADVNVAALNSHAMALNQYRTAIERGVSAYQLTYPA